MYESLALQYDPAMTKEEAKALFRNANVQLRDLSDACKSDKEVVGYAISREGGYALYYASEELKNDRELVLASVRDKGRMLRHLPEQMRGDPEVVMAAVENDPGAIIYASANCRSLDEIVHIAVQKNGKVLRFFPETYRHDKQLILSALQNEDVSVLEFAAKELLQDRDIVLKAIDTHFHAWKFINADWRKHPDVSAVLNRFSLITDPESGRRVYENTDLNLQVAEHDIGRHNWDMAMSVCSDWGKGWMLPDLKTLQILRRELYLKGIGEFEDGYYWSSSQLSEKSAEYLRLLDGVSSVPYHAIDHKKFTEKWVRPVRWV